MSKKKSVEVAAPTELVATVRPIRILKIAQCPTLSESGMLTYHVGITEEGEIVFRLWVNSGRGYFSREWVSANAIKLEADKVPVDQSITSFILHPLFVGKSANNPSFLFAVLQHEGFVKRSEVDERRYERVEPTAFITEIDALMKSDISLDPHSKPKKITKKKADEPPASDVPALPETVD